MIGTEGNWILAKGGRRLIFPVADLPGPALRGLADRFDSLFACPELAGNGDTLDVTGLIQFCGCAVSCSALSLLEIEDAVKSYNRHFPLRPGHAVLDVGAFEGLYSIYAATQVGPSGRVVAMEPEPGNLRRLRENISRSQLGQIELVDRGLWSTDGLVDFRDAGHASAVTSSNGASVVKVTTLATLLAREKIGRLDFVKMDIEGAEVEVLESSRELLRTLPAAWAIASYHRRDGQPTARRLEKIFQEIGYQALTENPAHPTTYAWPAAK